MTAYSTIRDRGTAAGLRLTPRALLNLRQLRGVDAFGRSVARIRELKGEVVVCTLVC
jgi:hypothetical protein